MHEYTKIELEVKNPQGVTKRFTCDMNAQVVSKGGKQILVPCPWLVNFHANYDILNAFTGYCGAFEVIRYNYLEGCSTEGEIESLDDEILATWKFLADGKPVTYEQLSDTCVAVFMSNRSYA